jgi:hypothetical protein
MKSSLVSLLGCAAAAAGRPVYIGCYMDCATPPADNCAYVDQRDLPTFFCSNGTNQGGGYCSVDSRLPTGKSSYASASKMTPSLCNDICDGFPFFGVQKEDQSNGSTCWCGNDYGNQGRGKMPQSECNSPCVCVGGGWWGHLERASMRVHLNFLN